MKRLYLTFVVSTLGFAQESSLLTEMIDKAIETHPKVQIEQYNIKSKEKNIDKAYGNFYPKVDINVDYGKRNTNIKPNGNDDTRTKYKGSNGEIKFTQNLFNGFADSSTLDYTKEDFKGSVNSKEIVVDDLIINVINSYSNIIRYRKLISIQEETFKKFDTYNKTTLENSQLTGLQTDYYVVNSKLEKLQSDLLENKWQLKKAQEQFKQLTGEYLVKDADINKLSFVEHFKLNEILNLIESSNSKLKKAKNDINLQQHEISIAQSNFYPTVDLEISGSRDNDLELYDTVSKEERIMLTFKYNIFNGFIDRANIKQKKIQRLRAKSTYEDIVRDLKEKITVQYQLYLTSSEKLKRLSRYLQSQTKLVELYAIEFDTGRRTMVNLVDSEQDLNDARITYTHTFFDLINSTYNLAYELGILKNELSSNNFTTIQEDLEQNATKVEVKKENKENYIISMASFSSMKNAKKFIDTYNIQSNSSIVEIKRDNLIFYKVIYGNFINKQEAMETLKTLIPKKTIEANKMSVKKIALYDKFKKVN